MLKIKLAYNTKQKEAILKCLIKNKEGHMNAEDVFMVLKNAGEVVGIATVYRNLNALVSEGIIKKFEVGNISCYQYDDNEECNNHYHLKCEKCNKVFHIESKALDGIRDEIMKKYDFDVNGAKLILYGKCKTCNE